MNAMRDDTPDERDSVLDRVDIHTVISGSERIPETVTDVIDAEGSAETASPPDAPAVVAWLFQEDAEPRQVALEELPGWPRMTPASSGSISVATFRPTSRR